MHHRDANRSFECIFVHFTHIWLRRDTNTKCKIKYIFKKIIIGLNWKWFQIEASGWMAEAIKMKESHNLLRIQLNLTYVYIIPKGTINSFDFLKIWITAKKEVCWIIMRSSFIGEFHKFSLLKSQETNYSKTTRILDFFFHLLGFSVFPFPLFMIFCSCQSHSSSSL